MHGKHPNKHIQEAIDYAVSKGWVIVVAGRAAHCYAKIRCGIAGHREHMMSIWSTPGNPEHHAKQIRRMIDRCSPPTTDCNQTYD